MYRLVCLLVLFLRQLYFLLFYWEVWQKCYMFHFVAGNKVLYFLYNKRSERDSSDVRPCQQLLDLHIRYTGRACVSALSIKCMMPLLEVKMEQLTSKRLIASASRCLKQPEGISILQEGFGSWTIYWNTTNIWILTPSKWWKANKPAPPGLENRLRKVGSSVGGQSQSYQWCIAVQRWCLHVPLGFCTVVEEKSEINLIDLSSEAAAAMMVLRQCSRSEPEWAGVRQCNVALCCHLL